MKNKAAVKLIGATTIVEQCCKCHWFQTEFGWGDSCRHIAIHNHFLPGPQCDDPEIFNINEVPDKCPCLVGKKHLHEE